MMSAFSLADWVAFFGHFLSLSLLAVGGAISMTPEMHRFLVVDKSWITDPQFTASIAIAQAAPGPNVLFVALLGWNVGFNAATSVGGIWPWLFGTLGLVLSMVGIMLPSTILCYSVSAWSQRNRHLPSVRAFKQGLAPVVVALLFSTGWVLAQGETTPTRPVWLLWVVTFTSAIVVWRTKIHLLWLLLAGAILGGFGLI